MITSLCLFLPAEAALPDVSVYCQAENRKPIKPEECGTTIQLQDGVNTISKAGTYLVQGSCVGQLIINAPDAEVKLLLSNISITSPDGPAVHIQAADKIVMTLADGTKNMLVDSPVYSLPDGEDEPNAALFSKADLFLNGTGTLQITAQYQDGLVSKDSLTIADANIVIESKGDAIRGKDSVLLCYATISAAAGDDGIKSTNDKDAERGWIYTLGSNVTIIAQKDGLQAETDLYLNGGIYNITSGGGCLPEYRQELTAPVRKADQAAKASTEETALDETNAESCKGMKAKNIQALAGIFNISSRDDAIHANGSITISDGYFELSSNDDGIHADDTFTMNGGEIVIAESYEGIEAMHILFIDGKTDVTAIDDGWNAASKAVSEAESGRRRKSHNFDITVSGGEHHILAGADAIDSNGNILITGGITYAASSNEMKEVAIDYPEICECRMTGGILVASGGYGKNTQTFNQMENQACVTLKWKEQQPSGTDITLLVDEQEVLNFAPAAAFKSIIVSAPTLQVGKKLTVLTNAEQTNSRQISEDIQFFPISQSRKTEKQTQQVNNNTEVSVTAETICNAFGTMTANPASGKTLGYWLYTPNNVGNEALPLIVYLHGGSGKGNDLTLITQADGFPKYVQEGKLGDLRAYVLIPQCPSDKNGWQSISEQVFALIDSICINPSINGGRVILTGHSMGGTGTWTLASLEPERFSCIVPMSGSVQFVQKNQDALSKLPIWVFVAENDNIVDPTSSTDFVSALNAVNPKAKYTCFENAGHRDVPALAWLNGELGLLDWMLSQ